MWPEIVEIPWIHVTIHSYGTLIVLAFLLGSWWAKRTAVRRLNVDGEAAFNVCFILLFVGIFGARLVHAFGHYAEFTSRPMAFLAIWEGGLVLYGGVLAGLLFLAWYLPRKPALKGFAFLDVLAQATSLSLVLGWFASLLAGDDYGKPTNVAWGIPTTLYKDNTNAVKAAARDVDALGKLHPSPVYGSLLALEGLGTHGGRVPDAPLGRHGPPRALPRRRQGAGRTPLLHRGRALLGSVPRDSGLLRGRRDPADPPARAWTVPSDARSVARQRGVSVTGPDPATETSDDAPPRHPATSAATPRALWVAFGILASLLPFVVSPYWVGPLGALAVVLALRAWLGPRVRPLAFGIGLLLPTALLLGFFVAIPAIRHRLYARAFDSAAWKAAGDERDTSSTGPRRNMVDDLLASRVLIGKTRAEVEDLLGPGLVRGMNDGEPGAIRYVVGDAGGFQVTPDPDVLVVRFGPDGRVSIALLTN